MPHRRKPEAPHLPNRILSGAVIPKRYHGFCDQAYIASRCGCGPAASRLIRTAGSLFTTHPDIEVIAVRWANSDEAEAYCQILPSDEWMASRGLEVWNHIRDILEGTSEGKELRQAAQTCVTALCLDTNLVRTGAERFALYIEPHRVRLELEIPVDDELNDGTCESHQRLFYADTPSLERLAVDHHGWMSDKAAA